MFDKKEECEQYTTFVCLMNGWSCSIDGFFIAVGLMMPVMTILLTLPIHFFKSLWVAKNGKLMKIQFQKALSCYYNYHNHLETSLHFLLFPVQILSF